MLRSRCVRIERLANEGGQRVVVGGDDVHAFGEAVAGRARSAARRPRGPPGRVGRGAGGLLVDPLPVRVGDPAGLRRVRCGEIFRSAMSSSKPSKPPNRSASSSSAGVS